MPNPQTATFSPHPVPVQLRTPRGGHSLFPTISLHKYRPDPADIALLMGSPELAQRSLKLNRPES